MGSVGELSTFLAQIDVAGLRVWAPFDQNALVVTNANHIPVAEFPLTSDPLVPGRYSGYIDQIRAKIDDPDLMEKAVFPLGRAIAAHRAELTATGGDLSAVEALAPVFQATQKPPVMLGGLSFQVEGIPEPPNGGGYWRRPREDPSDSGDFRKIGQAWQNGSPTIFVGPRPILMNSVALLSCQTGVPSQTPSFDDHRYQRSEIQAQFGSIMKEALEKGQAVFFTLDRGEGHSHLRAWRTALMGSALGEIGTGRFFILLRPPHATQARELGERTGVPVVELSETGDVASTATGIRS